VTDIFYGLEEDKITWKWLSQTHQIYLHPYTKDNVEGNMVTE
jgi:hypothetical protein